MVVSLLRASHVADTHLAQTRFSQRFDDPEASPITQKKVTFVLTIVSTNVCMGAILLLI